ncbi:MAG: hypothetical protein EZS28_018468, partial [Streblomastix strix]
MNIVISVDEGTFDELPISVQSELITLQGTDSFKTTQYIDPTSIPVGEKDNLIVIENGVVSFQNVIFQQQKKENSGSVMKHEASWVEIHHPRSYLTNCTFSESNFGGNKPGLRYCNGGAGILTDVVFTQVNGGALGVEYGSSSADMILRNVTFDTCTALNNNDGSCDPDSPLYSPQQPLSYPECLLTTSPVVFQSSFVYEKDMAPIPGYIFYSICSFKSCKFKNNQGYNAGAVELKGNMMLIAFVDCEFDGNIGQKQHQLDPSNVSDVHEANDMFISYNGPDESGTIVYGGNEALWSLGGCKSSSNAMQVIGYRDQDNDSRMYEGNYDISVIINGGKFTYDNFTLSSNGTKTGTGPDGFSQLKYVFRDRLPGTQNPLIVNVRQGKWDVINFFIGAVSCQIYGSGYDKTSFENSAAESRHLLSVVGGQVLLSSIELLQASTETNYGGLLVLRGDGLLSLYNISFSQTDVWQAQLSSTIFATAGDVQIENCIFNECEFDNSVERRKKSATVYCADKTGKVNITSSSFDTIKTFGYDSPITQSMRTDKPQIYGDGVVEYEGAAIYIDEAQQFICINTNLTRCDGWRVGGINLHKLAFSNMSLINCTFTKNKAMEGEKIQDFVSKMLIGNDLILDYKFLREDAINSIQDCSSISQFPLIGSKDPQFGYGVFDYLLQSSMYIDTVYASIKDGNDITGQGTQDQPYKTVSVATSRAASAQDRVTLIQINEGLYQERLIMIGGRQLGMQGEPIPDSQPQLPGPTILQNTEETIDEFIAVYNGTLEIHLLLVLIENRYEVIAQNAFYILSIRGLQSNLAITSCTFATVDQQVSLKDEVLNAERGANITIGTSYFEQILQHDTPTAHFRVQNQPLTVTNVTFTNIIVAQANSGAVKIEYYSTGSCQIEGCTFSFGMSLTANYMGSRTIGAAITLIFQEPSVESQSVIIRDCTFDTCMGDCCGALTVQGITQALVGLQISTCIFENNMFGSTYHFDQLPRASDVFFDMEDVQQFLDIDSENMIFE